MINILLLFVLCLVNRSVSHNADGIRLKEDLPLEKLNNKSPVKSFHTKSGYIVDCIDIYKQPAFDHPLLKNHKLQRKPSFKIGKTNVNISQTKPIFGVEKVQCPRETVPIRRTTEDDIVRAKSFFMNNNNHVLAQGIPGSHAAVVTLGINIGPSIYGVPRPPFYGVSGTTSVYNPTVENYQSSSSIMWVRNGAIDTTNLIAVGWHVAPQLYNDAKTHAYVVWTTDNFKSTGCFNDHCSGFVQTDSEFILGRVLDISGGGKTYVFPLSIYQDPKSKNWWVNMVNKNIGYFPASLFSSMTSADEVGWGGRTTTSAGSPSPPMGSGKEPDNNFEDSCFFANVAFQDTSRRDVGPQIDVPEVFSDNPKCYGVKYDGYIGHNEGYFLNFGGPGGNCDN